MRLAWWLSILFASVLVGLVLAWLAPSVRGVLATLPYLLVTELLFFAWAGGMSAARRRPVDDAKEMDRPAQAA